MQPLSGNERPDLRTSLMNMSCVLRLPRDMQSLQILFKCPTRAIVSGNAAKPSRLLTFDKVHNPLRLPRKTTSEPPKVVRTPGVLYILTSKCASRHNGVHFFDISTSKSGPALVCFLHFHLEMCFAPQRRALFSTSQLPKVAQTWCVLYILTSKCASRHKGVQFFISHLANWLRTRRFSRAYFSTLRRHKSFEKHSVSRLSYLFAHLHLLSSNSFSSTLLSSNLFPSLCLCPALLFICPYCRKVDF